MRLKKKTREKKFLCCLRSKFRWRHQARQKKQRRKEATKITLEQWNQFSFLNLFGWVARFVSDVAEGIGAFHWSRRQSTATASLPYLNFLSWSHSFDWCFSIIQSKTFFRSKSTAEKNPQPHNVCLGAQNEAPTDSEIVVNYKPKDVQSNAMDYGFGGTRNFPEPQKPFSRQWSQVVYFYY